MSAAVTLRAQRPAPMRRGLLVLLALVLLAVQTSLPAHQDSHPLNQDDSSCHYCMMGGHAGVPNTALPYTAPEFSAEAPRVYAERPASEPLVRTRYSRGPPSRI